MAKSLWTVGYGGRQPDELLQSLRDAGVEILVDVRWNPSSRKKGFSKSALWAAAFEAGLDYRHIRDLGAPGELRNDLSESNDFAAFSDAYLQHLAEQTEALTELADLAARNRVCILCVEPNPEDCHRGLLSERLALRGFQTHHLGHAT